MSCSRCTHLVHGGALSRGHAREAGVCENAPLDVLHEVEGSAKYRGVLAQAHLQRRQAAGRGSVGVRVGIQSGWPARHGGIHRKWSRHVHSQANGVAGKQGRQGQGQGLTMRGTGTGVPCSAASTRYSRSTACAEGSTRPGGFLRST